MTQADFPKPGMSTKKKWLIGCGGCLGVVIILAVVLAIVGGILFDKAKKASDETISAIFGPSYQHEGYMAFGFPVNLQSIDHPVMMIDAARQWVAFGFDLQVTPEQAAAIHKGDKAKILALVQTLGEQAASSKQGSSTRLQSVQVVRVDNLKLPQGQVFPSAIVLLEMMKKNRVIYSPARVAFIPEASGRVVGLVLVQSEAQSTVPSTDFTSSFEALAGEMQKIVEESELDSRLVKVTPVH